MPIYEYLCEACGKISELVQKVDEPPPRRCGECGSRRLAKLVSRSAFQLKGGGWYSDLYASRRQQPGGAAGETAPSEGGEKSSGAGGKKGASEKKAGGGKSPK